MTERHKERLWLAAMDYCGRCGCHQLPERSFFVGRWQLPLCARCTGALIGHLIGCPAAARRKLSLWAAVCCCEITLLDWTAQRLGIKASTNPRRLVTGIVGGFGQAIIYMRLLTAAVGRFGRREEKKWI